MKSQLAAVMEGRKEPELVKHSGEEISNQCSQIYDVIARRAFDIFESHGRSPGMNGTTGFAPNPSCYIRFL